jgi:hypothetical protein
MSDTIKLRKIKVTGPVTAAPLFIAASEGQEVDVPEDLAAQAVAMEMAEYVDVEAPEQAEKVTDPATKAKK